MSEDVKQYVNTGLYEDSDYANNYEADDFDSIVDNRDEESDAELSNQARQQIAEEQRLIEELEADAEEHTFDDDINEEEPERKKLTGPAGGSPCSAGGFRQNTARF